MSIYVIGDLHLSFFPGADKPMDIFGPRWADHARRLAERWKQTVRPEDTVVLPGDTSWALKLEEARYDLDWVAALPGRKILLKGNHDLWWHGITKLNRMYDNMTFLQNDHAEAEGCYICGSRGWLTPDNDDFTGDDERIYRRELLRLESSLKSGAAARERAMKEEQRQAGLDPDQALGDLGPGPEEGRPAPGAADDPEETAARRAYCEAHPLIGFLHYPPVSDPGRFSGFQQLFEDYGVRDVYYGHIHGEDAFRGRVEGDLHGIRYHLTSLDYLQCQPLLVR